MTEQQNSMHALMAELYPICRSITGDGVRTTLGILSKELPLECHEVPSGTRILDWTVPKEWNVREAYVAAPDGRRLIDFRNHNLHLMSYSTPLHRTVTRDELFAHLHTIPEHPDWIPYRTSYYHEDWGFCLAHRDLRLIEGNAFEVVIDTSFSEGALSYGELFLPGKSTREVLIYSHLCHPSLANDNLSGLAVTQNLAKVLSAQPNRYSYRFVWAPGTIGSIAWLARNESILGQISHGLVAVLLGGPGCHHYKQSQRGDRPIDRVVQHVLGHRNGKVLPFDPYGYDERQFCSPGFDLPIGRLTRLPNGCFPEYHTSADNLDFVKPNQLQGSLDTLLEIVEVIEHDQRYVNLSPKGEPQLGRRGLYRQQGGESLPSRELALLWTLNQSDGKHSLLDIAERADLPFSTIRSVASELESAQLLSSAAQLGSEERRE